MCPAQRRKNHYTRARYAFVFAVLCGLLGVGSILLKNPHSRADSYAALAASAYKAGRFDDALATATMSVRINPYGVEGWDILSKTYEARGQNSAALQVKRVLSLLQHKSNPADPLYAMPAALKLSLLSGTYGDHP